MNFLSRYLDRTEFDSYEDFIAGYKLNVPREFNFGYDIVDGYAAQCPDKKALLRYSIDENDVSHIEEYTFAEMKELSDRCANALRSLGVRKGDSVLMMLKEKPEVWIALTALIKLGAAAIPATFQLMPEDIVYRCRAASVRLILHVDDEQLTKHVTDALPECETVIGRAVVGDNIPEGAADLRQMIREASPELERVHTDNDDTMLMYFSSGTTGMPKLIQHDFTYPLGHITTAKYWQHVEDDGRHFTYSDSGWAKFAWGKSFGQWISGTELVTFDVPGRFDPAKLLRMINEVRLTTFCAPATVYRYLIKEDMSGCDFSSIHHCCTAGEPLNPAVFERFKEQTGQEIYEGFGQSEGSVLFANFGWDPIKLGSTGKPSPLYHLDLVDEDGRSVEDGVVGSIVIKDTDTCRPTGLFRRYYNDPEAMAHSWPGTVYNTGDMAWRDSDGYYWFEGRNDDVIKCSGYRIGPFEVESALMTHPAVLECAVTAVPDPDRGQVVKASVVLARGYTASEDLKKELQNHVKNTTAPYKYPRVLEFVTELPKTTSGKIRRAEIRRRDMEKYRAAQKNGG